MEIETIRTSDLSKCADHYVKVFNAPPWNDKWTKKAAFERLRDIYNTPRFYGIKLIESKKILGVLFGNIESWYKNYHFHIKEMYVCIESQRSGIGSILLQNIETILEKKNVQTIYLSTSSKHWVQKFYLKNKYKVIKNLQFMIKNMKVDNIKKKKER